MKLRLLLLCLFLIAPLPLAAEPENATLAALAAAEVPHRDRVELARQLENLGPLPSVPPAPDWAIGDQKSFWVTNSFENRTYSVEAALRAVSEHLYLWVDTRAEIDPLLLQALAQVFDRDVYQQVRDLWGEEASPGVDGDPRLYGLFAYGMGPGVAAYYASVNSYPQAVVPTSNAHEMFFFNLDTIGTSFPVNTLAGTMAHEFQHMIRQNIDPNEATWMDEGFSMFTELYIGFDNSLGHVYSFIANPHTQLNTWADEGPRLPHYGAALLFTTYVYERFGEDVLRAVSADPDDHMESYDRALREIAGVEAAEVFADWVLANYLHNPALEDGRYSYRLINGLSSVLPEEVITAYPYSRSDSANQYAADYLVLSGLDVPGTLSLSLDAPATVQLVPADAYSGRWMWYSNRQDESNTTLTRAFDLTGMEQATLNYAVWYHLENLWDYGYVMVSTDDGQTWTPLETPHTTTENPHHTAYGPGYTGRSDGWLLESVSLDAFAGQRVQVRFQVITDDAVNQPGMLIDDVSIPEIGYATDFEQGGGDWQAAGWVYIDNVLPQQMWVQVIEQTRDGATITRWPSGGTWELPLAADVEQVVIAISPFAPLTTVPMPYTLALDVR